MIKNILSDYGIYDINGIIEEKTIKIKNRLQLEIYSMVCKNIKSDVQSNDINWNLEYVEVSYYSGKFTYKRLEYSFFDKIKNKLLS